MDNIRYEHDHAKFIELTSIESNRNKIVKRGPFGLFETPICCKIKKIEGPSLKGELLWRQKNRKLRFLNNVTVPKNVRGGNFGIFSIHSVAKLKYRNL